MRALCLQLGSQQVVALIFLVISGPLLSSFFPIILGRDCESENLLFKDSNEEKHFRSWISHRQEGHHSC
jgi:hypothetical protein